MGGQAQDGEGPTQASAWTALSAWCRENLHLPIGDQHQKLTQKLEGHYGYYGIIGNYASLQKFVAVHRCSTVALPRSSARARTPLDDHLVFQATVPGLCPLRAASDLLICNKAACVA